MNISYLVWRLSFSALGLIGYLQGSLTLFWGVFGGPIAAEDARSVVTAFGFFSSFLTYILTTIVARKAYVRIQRLSAAVIAAQWSSLFLAILGLVTHLELFGWSDFLLKLALISWTGSLLVLFNVIWQIISVDRVKFRKPTGRPPLGLPRLGKTGGSVPPFDSFQKIDVPKDERSIKEFGIQCVDYYLKTATENEPPDRLFFPILLVAEKHFRPWRICSRFAAAGINGGEGVIYFGFNQPPDIILDQINKQRPRVGGRKEGVSLSNLALIDCYSSWIGSAQNRPTPPSPKERLPKTIRSDPRDVASLATGYNAALRYLMDRQIRQVRVVYDSISDFLQYSDPQLAMQFVKHNMVWEDLNKANSLYLYVPKVPLPTPQNPVDIEFLRWNAYCEVHLAYDEKRKQEHMFVDGLFARREETGIEMNTVTHDYSVKAEKSLPQYQFE